MGPKPGTRRAAPAVLLASLSLAQLPRGGAVRRECNTTPLFCHTVTRPSIIHEDLIMHDCDGDGILDPVCHIYSEAENLSSCYLSSASGCLYAAACLEKPRFPYLTILGYSELRDLFHLGRMSCRGDDGRCIRPHGYCAYHDAPDRDCDNDGIPDPYCYFNNRNNGYISSKLYCINTYPMGGCQNNSITEDMLPDYKWVYQLRRATTDFLCGFHWWQPDDETGVVDRGFVVATSALFAGLVAIGWLAATRFWPAPVLDKPFRLCHDVVTLVWALLCIGNDSTLLRILSFQTSPIDGLAMFRVHQHDTITDDVCVFIPFVVGYLIFDTLLLVPRPGPRRGARFLHNALRIAVWSECVSTNSGVRYAALSIGAGAGGAVLDAVASALARLGGLGGAAQGLLAASAPLSLHAVLCCAVLSSVHSLFSFGLSGVWGPGQTGLVPSSAKGLACAACAMTPCLALLSASRMLLLTGAPAASAQKKSN